jgi:MATE family multidrug resistance protein
VADGALRPGGTRELLRLAWPAVVNMLSFTVMSAADTYFAGKVGTAEQAAVGFCGTLIWALLCFFVGTLELVQTFVAQCVGAGDDRGASRWGSVGLHLSVVFALAVLPIAFAGGPLFRAAGISPDMVPAAETYFRIRMIGTLIYLPTRVGDAWFRGIGDTITPMVVAVAVNLVNCVLDAAFVLGWEPLSIPALGVAGVAWATVAATLLQVVIYQWLWWGRRAARREAPRYRHRTTWSDVRELVRVGAPSGFHWLLDLGAWTMFTVAVARLDAVQSAANLIGITIIRAAFMPAYGISTAAQTLVGQYLGARDRESAARSGWTSVRVTSVYMAAMGLSFAFLGRQLVAAFTDDPAVVDLAARLMLWAALFQLGDGVQVVLAGALRGAGDTRYVMLTSLAGAWFVFAPLAFGLMRVLDLGVEAGWIAINAWVIALSALLIARFCGGRWKEARINLEPRPLPETDVA